MNKTQWEDLIGKIDSVYIEEAEQWNKAAQKKTRRRHFVSMAACICILLITAIASFDLFFPKKEAPAEMAANPESAADTDQTILNEAAPASEKTDKNDSSILIISLPYIEETLKHFFKDYRNYYYLPEEDRAVHKSVGCYVERKYRRAAKASTCYIKKAGIFLPIPKTQKHYGIQIERYPYQDSFPAFCSLLLSV